MSTTQAGYPQMSAAQHLEFAIKTQRATFEAMPPKLQAERLAYVQYLLEAEQRRGQKQPSWLAQHAKEIYGL